MASPYYIFREAESVNELKSLFILRDSVSRGSVLEKMGSQKQYCASIDYFDMRSHHFGLYEHRSGTSRPAGYIRMTTDRDGPMRKEVESICSECPKLSQMVEVVPAVRFPFMTFYPKSEGIQSFYENAKARNEKVAEIGSFSLDPSVQSAKMVADFFSATIAAGLVRDVKHHVQVCVPAHVGLYQRFGFRELEQTGPMFDPEHHAVYHCLGVDRRGLPDGVRDQVLEMAGAFFQTGRIHLNPAVPGIFFPPLSSFVPSRAALRAAA